MRAIILCLALMLASCGVVTKTEGPVKPIGDFALGFVSVVAPNAAMAPMSREASKEELVAALQPEISARLARFEKNDQNRFYNLGISIEAYILAKPGVPIVLSPQSVMIIKLWVWDDAKAVKLNQEPILINVIEQASGKTLLGSGLTQSAEQQLASLARVAASEIELRLRQKFENEGWFANNPIETDVPDTLALGEPAQEPEGNESKNSSELSDDATQEIPEDFGSTSTDAAPQTLAPLLRPSVGNPQAGEMEPLSDTAQGTEAQSDEASPSEEKMGDITVQNDEVAARS